jgi:hypothetical protein
MSLPKHNDPRLRALLLSRLVDYERDDTATLQARLIEKWRAVHPLAAAESSRWLHPLMRDESWVKTHPQDPDEQWWNDVYYVSFRRHKKDAVFGTDGGMIQLGISSIDGTARHDWRDLQAIKNQLAGAECEAFELYPAESRLLDPSNYYTLWCFPGVKKLKIGIHDGRDVRDADQNAYAPQRAIAKPPEEQSPKTTEVL